MGRSDRRTEGYTIETLVEEARDALTAAGFGTETPPVVIGHSLGGLVSLEAFAERPDIGGIVVIDSPLSMTPSRFEEIRDGTTKSHAERRPFASLAEGLARFRLSPPQPCANPYMIDHIARTALVEEEGRWFWHFDPRRLTVSKRGVGHAVERAVCPVAFFHGDRSALLNAETLAATRAVLPPGTPMIAIPDAAHHVPLDQPLALVAALRALLTVWPRPIAR